MRRFYFKFTFFFLLFFPFNSENLYGLETEWSSNHGGFSKVKWNQLFFDSKIQYETLSFLKAASSLYQGIENEEGFFNNSPNFATLTIGIVVKTSERTKIFYFPIKDEPHRYIIFSSSNRGVYGKDILPEVAEFLEFPSKWRIYSYGDLYKYSDPSLIRQKSAREQDRQIHSEDLMAIFMNSPRGKRFLKTCLESIKEQLKAEEFIEIIGGIARIHSFWDVCDDCLSFLKASCVKNFLPDLSMATSLGFSRSVTPFYVLNTFSEMPYNGNPGDLTGKPKIINSTNPQNFLIVSSRRKKDYYATTFSDLLEEFRDIIQKYKTPSTHTPRKRRVIDSDDELEKQEPPQSLEIHTPLPVLKWMGMILAHPQNKEVLFKAGLCDEDIMTFCSKALLPDLWGYPFSHHYGWEKWEALKERNLRKGSYPFLYPQKILKKNSPPLPPFLLLSGEEITDSKSTRHESALQRKWLNYNPYKYAIPHFGWNEITVIDVEEGVGLTNVGEKAQCQMCGNTQLIHLHHVSHPNSGQHLFVGSECVQFMTMKKDEILKSLERSQEILDQTLSSQSEERSRKRKKLVRYRQESQEGNLSENEAEIGVDEAVEIILSLT